MPDDLVRHQAFNSTGQLFTKPAVYILQKESFNGCVMRTVATKFD